MIQLPAEFEERMKQLLGGEYCRFAESYEKERAQGLRMNRLKGEREDFLRQFADFGLRPVPWAADGFYYDGEARPGKSPYHEAGAYYIQEPRANSGSVRCPGRKNQPCRLPSGRDGTAGEQ